MNLVVSLDVKLDTMEVRKITFNSNTISDWEILICNIKKLDTFSVFKDDKFTKKGKLEFYNALDIVG